MSCELSFLELTVTRANIRSFCFLSDFNSADRKLTLISAANGAFTAVSARRTFAREPPSSTSFAAPANGTPNNARPKRDWPEPVRQYVQRAFASENSLPGIDRLEMETKLKHIISDAASSETLHIIDWANLPLPQQVIQKERIETARSVQIPAIPVWKSSFSTPSVADTNLNSYPDIQNSKKRKSSEWDDQQAGNQVVPPWRATADRNVFEARISYPDKRQRNEASAKGSSKSQYHLENRKKRFENGQSGYLSPPHSTSASVDAAVSMTDEGPVVGRCQDLEKKYFRLTSAPNPMHVRPLEVLEKTLELLKKKWRKENNYSYICDQFKSLRQDLTVQHIKTEFTVNVYEIHARIALEKGDLGEYNQCQTQLRALYTLRLGGHPMEFKAYRILYFIHTCNRTDMNDILADLTPAEKKDAAVKHALDARSALALGSYHRFFQLYLDTPNMGAYLMDMFVSRERLAALSNMCKAYKPDVKLRFLTEELGFESDDESARFICEHGGQAFLGERDDGVRLLTGKASGLFEPAKSDAFRRVDIKGNCALFGRTLQQLVGQAPPLTRADPKIAFHRQDVVARESLLGDLEHEATDAQPSPPGLPAVSKQPGLHEAEARPRPTKEIGAICPVGYSLLTVVEYCQFAILLMLIESSHPIWTWRRQRTSQTGPTLQRISGHEAMKAFRRSVKGEKADSRLHHISLTPKSAIAIMPPKKVIKALYDYSPDPNHKQELAFSKGDFFHVISREDDQDWYEACNPLIPTARGLVPVSYFEIIGKTERQSGGSAASGASNIITQQVPHDSGYSEPTPHNRQEPSTTPRTVGHSRMSSLGKASGAMVYGMVQYDFNAERPDELEAKAGEAIIVIAQSNPEWFVAKPIGRLGGPGLIPVSFIEIRDMATDEPVPDAQAAVARAGVPKVEEWKKMAKDYKDSSITLGKIEAASAQNAQRDLERMSLSNSNQPYNYSNGNGSSQSQAHHQRSGSRSNQNGYNRQSSQSSARTLLAPATASIPRYCFENDKYWYIIECAMEDGRHWELSRFYPDFYDFQIALLREFPREADSSGGTRTLPYMPGPVTYVTDAISNGRRESLNDYVKKLLALPPYISKCHLVRQLFAPREGDFELDPRAIGEDYRLSGASQQSSVTDSLSRTASRQSSRGQMNGGSYPPGSMGPPHHRISHQRSNTSVPNTNGSSSGYPNHRSPQENQSQAAINRQPSSLTQASGTSSGTHHSTPATSAPNTSTTNVASSGALKIKVFFEDDLIAIRVPSEISFQQLRDKLKDRLKIEDDIVVQYKDEPSGTYAELLSDRDLDVALGRNPKLTLYVGYA